MKFFHVRLYNDRGQYCDWHYMVAMDEADAREALDPHDRVSESDEDTFRSSYNPRGVQWPQSIRHVYTEAAKREIASRGECLGGVRILGA